jgi:hypothetical protein
MGKIISMMKNINYQRKRGTLTSMRQKVMDKTIEMRNEIETTKRIVFTLLLIECISNQQHAISRRALIPMLVWC